VNAQIKVNNINSSDNDLHKRNREVQKTINKIQAESKLFRMVLEEYIRRGGILNE
jgi:hypothetical protein